ncbi:hypothetical protein F5Y10DRAFT_275816 [Nemania abortiva]|nr:hypothetical protein F5Y10DRAFT_275816 [Nemania abortiva]
MAARPGYRRVTPEASPPPYNDGSEPNCASQRQPGPATSGRWYEEDTQLETIRFLFCPDPSQDPLTQDWGLHWDNNNVINEDGSICQHWDPGTNIRPDGERWSGTRSYFLKDLQQSQRWTATIKLLALHDRTLYHFDLSQLPRDKIHNGKGFSQAGHSIYQYDHNRPESCYNVIYHNMPMEEYWSWPR